MTDDTRERLAALEVEFKHIADQLSATREEMAAVKAMVSEMRDLLTQAKGARWAILAAIGVGGFVAAKSAIILSWLGIAAKP